MTRSGFGALAAIVLASATPVFAQSSGPVTTLPSGVTFLSRSSFHLTAEHLSGEDERFVWDTNFGGDLDLVEYGYGRLRFEANYQAILGEQFRPFDPTQGNYILAGSLSARVSGIEASGVFFHQSRHLSDRAKRQPVDWNMIGAGVEGVTQTGGLSVHGRADVRGVVQKSFVDYRWEIATSARADYPIRNSLALLASGGVRWIGTDGTRNRGTQVGARGEGGVRVFGTGAAVELFVAVEKRIDPYPLEFGSDTWTTAGFRLLSR